MIVDDDSVIRSVKRIPDEQILAIKNFLQGAVYGWCMQNGKDWFGLRHLVGGTNFHWQRTPLYALYDKHIRLKKSSDDAVTAAAKDAGWLLKRVLADDKRHFLVDNERSLTNEYSWNGQEDNWD